MRFRAHYAANLGIVRSTNRKNRVLQPCGQSRNSIWKMKWVHNLLLPPIKRLCQSGRRFSIYSAN